MGGQPLIGALLALSLLALPPSAADQLQGVAAAELVLARAERAALLTTLGDKHPVVLEVTARIERLRPLAAHPIQRAASAVSRERIGRAWLRATRLKARLSEQYGPRHPRLRALDARLKVLRAALPQEPESPATRARFHDRIRLARLDGRERYYESKGYGPLYPARVALTREREELKRRIGPLRSGERPAAAQAFMEAVLAIDREEQGHRAASAFPEIRRLAHERDAVLLEAAALLK